MEKNLTGVYSFFNTSITSQVTAEEFENIWTATNCRFSWEYHKNCTVSRGE